MQVDNVLKGLYKSDSTEKNLFLDFYHPGEEEPFLTLSGVERIDGGSMKIHEAISSSENLDFGSCEATQFEITVIDVEENLTGATLVAYQTLQGVYPSEDLYPAEDLYPDGYVMPLGTYIVQSAPRQTNARYRDVLALDQMCLFDVDVIDWYNALPFPLTLRDFRARLCARIGVTEQVPDYLPNDNMLVEKTIDTAELIARDVLVACEQINGAFGHFDRNGILQHVIVEPNMLLYPSEDLYPSEELVPGEIPEGNAEFYNEILESYLCISCKAEEYIVQPIDTVHIRQEEGDIGAIYGGGKNCYIVEGNFLVYGKTAKELENIAAGIHSMISGFKYVPFEYRGKGLPYLEVGSSVWLQKEGIASYIMKRTLTGTFALKDDYSATGEEIRGVESNVNTEIIQLKGRSAVLKKTVEEVSATVTNLENQTVAKFKILSDQITSEVTRAKGTEAELSSKITQQADLIELKVSKGEISSQLSLESGQVYIAGNRLVVDSTNFKLDSSGNATYSGKVTGATISGSAITGGSVKIGDIIDADEDGICLGDYEISVDNTGLFKSADGNIMFETAATPSGVQFKFGNLTYTGGDLTNAGDITASGNLEGHDLVLEKSWWMGVSITKRVQFLSDCLWELANIIDDQWSNYDNIYDALNNYYEDNKPW